MRRLLKRMKKQRKDYEKARASQGKSSAVDVEKSKYAEGRVVAEAEASGGGDGPVWREFQSPPPPPPPSGSSDSVAAIGDWRATFGITSEPPHDTPGGGRPTALCRLCFALWPRRPAMCVCTPASHARGVSTPSTEDRAASRVGLVARGPVPRSGPVRRHVHVVHVPLCLAWSRPCAATRRSLYSLLTCKAL